MTIYVNSDTINSKVSFTSKSSVDPVKWTGTVIGVLDYVAANQFGDLLAYNAAVQKIDPTVTDVTTLHYFIIRLDNDSNETTTPLTQIFANEWIATFAIINAISEYRLGVLDMPNNGITAIQTLLQSAGYRTILLPS